MDDSRTSLSEVVDFLRANCAMSDLILDHRLFSVKFDALLVGTDPLNVVAVEQKADASETRLKQSIRKAQSFAWTAHANNKLALLNLVLFVPVLPNPEVLQSIESKLSGTARLFVVSETMQMDEIAIRLSLLAAPRLAQNTDAGLSASNLATMLSNAGGESLEWITKRASSVEDLVEKLLDRLRILASEVDRAIDED